MSGQSNSEWGELAAYDNEQAEVWDTFATLPDAGANPALDAFCERKRIDIPALLRLGARLSDDTVLAFAYPGGIKYRDINTGKRWAYTGSEWHRMKLVPSVGSGDPTTAIVAEGETDAARLTMLYPDADVYVMPAGARAFPPAYAEQLAAYELALVALDNDEAGEAGASKIMELCANAMRFAPPDVNDWCELDGDPPPLPTELERPAEASIIVAAGDLLEMEAPEVASWFEQALLPIGGLAILHGGWKSFKSFMGFDMMSAIAQGQDWCTFEPTEEPARVAIIQFEIPWKFYKDRVQLLFGHARSQDSFKANFLTYSPLARPRLTAGNKAEEDAILMHLTSAGVQVVLVDPIRRAMGTRSLNDEHEVRHMLAFFERLQDEGITVVATHHDNKESMRHGGGDSTGMTGSGAFGGDPDTLISVELPKDCRIEEPKRNLRFLLRNGPSPAPRGMELQEDGKIVYSTEPHGDPDGDDQDDEGDPVI